MTRINMIDPSLLADQHLMAEWREIKHVPSALMRRLQSHSIKETLAKVPPNFTLNTGHISFFMDKIDYLTERYYHLTEELEKRGYVLSEASLQNYYDWIEKVPDEFFKSQYKPTARGKALIIERITLRISEKPQGWYRYYGEVKNLEFFVKLMGDGK